MSLRIAIVLLVLAAASCKAKPGDAAVSSQSESETPRDVIACPKGAVMRGAAPPDGDRLWCETAAGVSHGPFRSWWPDGRTKTEGTFEQGEPAGEWTSWYADGQLRSRGRYEGGEPVGEWERFAPDGSRQVPEPKIAEVVEPPPQQPVAVVGIPICDEYIDKFTKCLANVPEAARLSMQDALKSTIEAWKQAADDPTSRQALEQGCRAASDAMKQATQSIGCEW